jgi:copper oxidase (laccase) domain-containing protein
VDQLMFDQVIQAHPESAGVNRRLNLFAGLVAQIPQVRLSNMNICTLENPNYFSFRRGAESGRQVGVICL